MWSTEGKADEKANSGAAVPSLGMIAWPALKISAYGAIEVVAALAVQHLKIAAAINKTRNRFIASPLRSYVG